MPVTPAQKQLVLETVRDFTVEDFGNNFEPIYERAHQVLRDFPLRVDEEIRNVLNHFRLAYDAEDFDSSMANVIRGRRHIYFAIYLCLTQIIDHQLKLAGNHLGTLNERTDQRVSEFRSRLAGIKGLRRSIPNVELVVRPTSAKIEDDINWLIGVNQRLEVGILQFNKFHADLTQVFPSQLPTGSIDSLGYPDRLDLAIGRIVLIENQESSLQSAELRSLISEQRALLAKEERHVWRPPIFFLIFLALLLVCVFLVVDKWWAGSFQTELRFVAVPFAVLFVAIAYFIIHRSRKFKNRVDFELEVLKKYEEARLEWLDLETKGDNTAAIP